MTKSNLTEDTRNQLIQQSKQSDLYSPDYREFGKNRHARRLKSRISNSVKEYNQIDMNKLFKDDLLDLSIRVNGESDIYLVEISFTGFLNQVSKYLNKDSKEDDFNYRVISRALISALNSGDVKVHCTCKDFCLSGDTEIKLSNGACYTIQELFNRFKNGEEIVVKSKDGLGSVVDGTVTDIWITGEVKELIRVTLEDDSHIDTTINHRYMVMDGTYKEAQELTIDDLLMSDCCAYIDTFIKKDDSFVHHCNLYKKIKNIELLHFDEPIPVYDLTVDKYNNFYVKSDVVLHNCYREAYWATVNGINAGAEERRPSDITNPNDTKGLCKHINLILNNNSWSVKTTSVIKNYFFYMKEHYPRLYADVMYPAVFGREYIEPVQMDLLADDESAEDSSILPSEDNDIDISNKWSKTKGQFKQGNEFRFDKTSTGPMVRGQEKIFDLDSVDDDDSDIWQDSNTGDKQEETDDVEEK